MNDLEKLLPDRDRELTIRPFDARWEAILTVYARHGNDTYRVVAGTPTQAIAALLKEVPSPR